MASGQDLVKLLEKYSRREPLSEEEFLALESWWKQSSKNRLLAEVFREAEMMKERKKEDAEETAMVWSDISKGLDEMNVGTAPVVSMRRKRPYWKVAVAVVVLSAAAGVYLHRRSPHEERSPQEELVRTRERIELPETRGVDDGRVVLTRPDGSQVDLDRVRVGEIVETDGHSVLRKITDDCVAYDAGSDDDVLIPRLRAGAGHRPYIARMPDGTLNYLSDGMEVSMDFNKRERHIRILHAGKLRCDVARSAGRPLVVDTRDSLSVEDMGTSFQVEVNDVRRDTRVVLLTGAVRVQSEGRSVQLDKRWQEAVGSKGQLKEMVVEDTAGLTGWSDRALMFHFRDVSLAEALQQVAWWYKCAIVYKDTVQGRRFGGDMRVTPSVDDIIAGIRETQRHYANIRREANTLVVSKW